MALSEFFLNNFETSDNALDQRLKIIIIMIIILRNI